MAAVYGSSYFWNVSIYEDVLRLQQLLKGHFSTITLISGTALAILGPFIMFANGIVIAAIWKDPFKQLRSSPSNIIITSMAVCDFLVGFCAIFLEASFLISMSLKSRASEYLGPLAYGSGVFLIAVSIGHVLALTFDRVVAVVHPLLYKSRVTRNRVNTSVVIIWLTCPISGLLQIPLNERYYINSVISMTIFNILGLPVIFLSLVIIYYVKRQSRELKKTKGLTTDRKILSERERKTTKSVLIILAFSGICFFPFFIAWLFLIGCARCHSSLDAVMTSFYICFVFTQVSSGINPILYAFRLPKFKKPIAMIMREVFFCYKQCGESDEVEPSETSENTPRASVNVLEKSKDQSIVNTKL